MADDEQAAGNRSRRELLQGLGVVVVAGTAGYVGFTEFGPKPIRAVNSASGSSGKSGSGYGEATGETTGAGGLVALSKIPDNGGLVLQDAKLVLTRSGDTVHCFTAVCTHLGCLVSEVRDGVISCPCHGSQYNAETGAVVHGPAQAPLAAVAVVVQGDEVVRG
ncbi:Rieske (2Fe-2S) protein [Pengzhenrongella sp.]|jgi:Rieske Fe-S protein|uniref:Rieske (2Fe-2S) protein n=1 Tax=Pengzhenrongella sp. TaxID=2888820 RepID=UPI002F954082